MPPVLLQRLVWRHCTNEFKLTLPHLLPSLLREDRPHVQSMLCSATRVTVCRADTIDLAAMTQVNDRTHYSRAIRRNEGGGGGGGRARGSAGSMRGMFRGFGGLGMEVQPAALRGGGTLTYSSHPKVKTTPMIIFPAEHEGVRRENDHGGWFLLSDQGCSAYPSLVTPLAGGYMQIYVKTLTVSARVAVGCVAVCCDVALHTTLHSSQCLLRARPSHWMRILTTPLRSVCNHYVSPVTALHYTDNRPSSSRFKTKRASLRISNASFSQECRSHLLCFFFSSEPPP